MRITEQSPSGAVIELRGTTRNVRRLLAEWREHHANSPDSPVDDLEDEGQGDGPTGTQALVERAPQHDYDRAQPVTARADRPFGFTMNAEVTK